jgi:hypothetical protein
MKEHPVQQRVMLLSRGATRLWRNNCGMLQDRFGKWVRFGVANPGGSDLIGFHSVIITPDMVGKKVAIFTAFEVKRSSGGKATDKQLRFIDLVKCFGGIAGVVRSEEEAKSLLTE